MNGHTVIFEAEDGNEPRQRVRGRSSVGANEGKRSPGDRRWFERIVSVLEGSGSEIGLFHLLGHHLPSRSGPERNRKSSAVRGTICKFLRIRVAGDRLRRKGGPWP
ncbi:MAG: hypothetical protein WCK39_04065 [Methanomassiliicoccales archaeon]